MPRYYSRSLGRVVEEPYGNGQVSGGQTGTGIDPKELLYRLTVANMIAQNPKQSSQIKSVTDLIEPMFLGTDEQRALQAVEQQRKQGLATSFRGGQTQLGVVKDLLNQYQGKDVSGLGPKIKSKFFKGFSKEGLLGGLAPSSETDILESSISDYNTRLFEIAGKAFTGPERDILEGLVLDIGDDEQRMRNKIQQAQALIQRKAQEEGIGLPGGTPQQTLNTLVPQIPQQSPTVQGGGGQPTPSLIPQNLPGRSILNLLFGRNIDFTEKALQGQLAQQQQPLTTTQGLSQLLGPAGLLLSGRGDVVRETAAPAVEISSYALAPGLYKQFGGTKAGGFLGGLRGGTSPEEQTVGQRTGSTLLGAGTGALLGKIFESIASRLGRGKAAQALGEETQRRDPIKSTFGQIRKELESRTESMRKVPIVEDAHQREMDLLGKSGEFGDIKSGGLLDDLLNRINPLGRFGRDSTGEQKVLANYYRVYGNILRDELIGVNPLLDDLLKTASREKAQQAGEELVKDAGLSTLLRAGLWRLVSKIPGL